MDSVPVYYLRKPWYILLKYSKSLVSDWKPDLKKINRISSIDIIEYHIDKDINYSDEENEFNQENKLSFKSAFSIKRGAIPALCIVMPKKWQELATKDTTYQYNKDLKEVSNSRTALKRSGLQNDVNKHLTSFNIPIIKSKDTSIRYETALYICLLAKYACRDNSEESEQIHNIYKAIKRVVSNPGKNVETSKNDLITHSDLKREINRNSIPKVFHNTQWISHERTDANSNKKASWGIAQSYIYIGYPDNKGEVLITFESRYNEVAYKSKGIISYEVGSKYLIAHVVRQSNPGEDKPETSSFFAMRVRDAENQSLMIGHYSNYSIYFERYITKVVVWTQVKGEFSPKDLVNVNSGFKKIDINIRRFLNNRAQNRLTLPHEGLSNLKNPNDKDRSLHWWLLERIHKVQGDKKLRACVGKYYICYFYGASENITKFEEKNQRLNDQDIVKEYIAKFIRIDEMQIIYDDEAVSFSSNYTHHTYSSVKKKSGYKPILYEGKVVRKHSTIQLSLENIVYRPKTQRIETTDGDLILLTFQVPHCHEDKAEELFNHQDYFEGILSGFSDASPEHNPLSFRTLIIKQNSEPQKEGKKGQSLLNIENRQDRNELSNKIIEYFYKNKSQYQIRVTR